MYPSRGPKFLPCYICGGKFIAASIGIHEPQCLDKWKAENSRLPRGQRRPPPRKPDVLKAAGKHSARTLDDAAWQSMQSQLVPCGNCGRTFAPDRLTVHQRVCKPRPGHVDTGPTAAVVGAPVTAQSTGSTDPNKPVGLQGPRYVLCYICGEKYGSKSLVIHEPQCLTKWKIQNEKLPPGMRRPAPKKPAVGKPIASAGRYDLDAMNEMAYSSSQAQLVPCPNCARTFAPNRISIHQRACKPKT